MTKQRNVDRYGAAALGDPLTMQEIELLRALAEGVVPSRLGAATRVSYHTANDRLHSVQAKLGDKNPQRLVALWTHLLDIYGEPCRREACDDGPILFECCDACRSSVQLGAAMRDMWAKLRLLRDEKRNQEGGLIQ